MHAKLITKAEGVRGGTTRTEGYLTSVNFSDNEHGGFIQVNSKEYSDKSKKLEPSNVIIDVYIWITIGYLRAHLNNLFSNCIKGRKRLEYIQVP